MEQADLLRVVSDVLEANGIVHGFTGSQASSMYGENRFTNDIDVVVDIRQQSMLDAFLKAFPESDFYVSDVGASQAVANGGGQFNIIHHDSSQKVDVIIQADPTWPDELARRRRLPLSDGKMVWFVAPEDLILHKMNFYREGESDRHLRDIASMLKIDGEHVDRAYIDEWADRLGLGDIWRHILGAVGL